MTDTVLNTAHVLIEISEELVGCAKGLGGVVTTGGEEHQVLVEKAEILRRDWSAKVREPHPLIANYNYSTCINYT